MARGRWAEGMKIPELAMRNGELKVRRILSVASVEMGREWLVVELQDLGGSDIANVAISSLGAMMMVEDCRGRVVDEPLDLTDAKNRVRRHRRRDPQNAEYRLLQQHCRARTFLYPATCGRHDGTGIDLSELEG